jgi:hypothetical protein
MRPGTLLAFNSNLPLGIVIGSQRLPYKKARWLSCRVFVQWSCLPWRLVSLSSYCLRSPPLLVCIQFITAYHPSQTEQLNSGLVLDPVYDPGLQQFAPTRPLHAQQRQARPQRERLGVPAQPDRRTRSRIRGGHLTGTPACGQGHVCGERNLGQPHRHCRPQRL